MGTYSNNPELNAVLEQFLANVAGDSYLANERRRAESLARERERDKPKARPAPIPTGQQRVLQETGGKLMGPRMAADAVAATDPRLKDSTVRFFMLFTWEYQPGRVYRKPAKRIGDAAGLKERTTQQAVAQLKRFGYLARCRGGWVVPMVELKLTPDKRAWNEQRSFDFVTEWDTFGAAKYPGLVESTTRKHLRVHPSETPP